MCIHAKTEEDYTPNEIQKHIALYQSKFGNLSAFELVRLRKVKKQGFKTQVNITDYVSCVYKRSISWSLLPMLLWQNWKFRQLQ